VRQPARPMILSIHSDLSWLISEVAKPTKRSNKVDESTRLIEPMIFLEIQKQRKKERKCICASPFLSNAQLPHCFASFTVATLLHVRI